MHSRWPSELPQEQNPSGRHAVREEAAPEPKTEVFQGIQGLEALDSGEGESEVMGVLVGLKFLILYIHINDCQMC